MAGNLTDSRDIETKKESLKLEQLSRRSGQLPDEVRFYQRMEKINGLILILSAAIATRARASFKQCIATFKEGQSHSVWIRTRYSHSKVYARANSCPCNPPALVAGEVRDGLIQRKLLERAWVGSLPSTCARSGGKVRSGGGRGKLRRLM